MTFTSATEPQATIDLMSEAGRLAIASRLRHLAQLLAEGKVTPDAFALEPEWYATAPNRGGVKGCSPTGRMQLTLGYWSVAVEDLPA